MGTFSMACPSFVVALDINGTICEGDTLATGGDDARGTGLTLPARKLIANLSHRIMALHQEIHIVLFTLGRDWPGVAREIKQLSGGAIAFDTQDGALYVGRKVGDATQVFLRQLVGEQEQQFTHDGVVYPAIGDRKTNRGNPMWLDPGAPLC